MRNERTLRKIPGVRDANVNLGTRRARVEFDEAAVSEPALRDAIVENGYEVLAGEGGDHRQLVREEVRAAKSRAFSAIALATPALRCRNVRCCAPDPSRTKREHLDRGDLWAP